MKSDRNTLKWFTFTLVLEVLLVAGAIALVCATSAHGAPPESPPQAARSINVLPARKVCVLPLFTPGTATIKGLHLRSARSKHNSIYWRNQRKVVAWLVTEGVRRHLPRVFIVAALSATTTESGARELDHGDGSSLGPLQLIDIHGSAADRQTIAFSGNWFYNGARKVYRPGMTAAQLAQAVERSRFPSAYTAHVPEARRNLALVLGPCRLRR